MDVPAPLQKFRQLLSQSDFTFIVYYRGHWCPFCMHYLSTFTTLVPAITAAGGTPVIITAEPEEFLKDTRAATKYEGEAIVDTEHIIAQEMKKRAIATVAITDKKGYEHGLTQPAVVVLKRDGTVLESWAIVPGVMNLGGAKDRPQLDQIWANVQAKMDNKPAVYKSYSLLSAASVLGRKLFGWL